MAEIRQSGLYWVKRFGFQWSIGDYDSDMEDWVLLGTEESFKDSDFTEIAEKVERAILF